MLNNRVQKLKENTHIINSIMKLEDIGLMNEEMDKLLNTVRIMYESREDFEENFPAPEDLYGKINLVLTRRT